MTHPVPASTPGQTPTQTPAGDRPATAAWRVGAAEVDLTPTGSVFLFGYPHVPRMSTGVGDPLLASAAWFESDSAQALLVGCDLILLTKALADRARRSLSASLGLPTANILISATHTHSGPVTSRMVSNEADTVVPSPDGDYLARVEASIVAAAREARDRAEPATVRSSFIASEGLGSNRRDPSGPTLDRWPVVYANRLTDDSPIAVMSVCAMHPTVLHEDSTLVSGDFPGLARRAVKSRLGDGVVYLHHLGASGNQSPRHVVTANSLPEAQRLGGLLADRLLAARDQASALLASIDAQTAAVDLPRRQFPSVTDASDRRDRALARFQALRQGDDATAARTAETDWFGAEETLTLSRAAHDGRLEAAAAACLPAEIQAIRLGGLWLVGWPGEVFVEFALDLQSASPNAGLPTTPQVVTLANGDLQGYVVTDEAVRAGAYEAGNAIFASPESGHRLVDATLTLLKRMAPVGAAGG